MTQYSNSLLSAGSSSVSIAVRRKLRPNVLRSGAFCPLFRLHGDRSPPDPNSELCGSSGGPNEVWEFGTTAFEVIPGVMRLRENLREYVMEQMTLLSAVGAPVVRPMVYDFADDACYQAEDQFMFGPDWIVAPVTEYNVSSAFVICISFTLNNDVFRPQVGLCIFQPSLTTKCGNTTSMDRSSTPRLAVSIFPCQLRSRSFRSSSVSPSRLQC